jgi:DNA-binding transcriptional regulator YdaS (Cro superfamily)
MTDWKEPIRRAAEIVGGVKQLERKAGLPRNTVSFSLRDRVRAPPIEIVIAISRATGGAVKISDIVPHVVKAVLKEANRERRKTKAA